MASDVSCLVACRRLRVAQLRRNVGCPSLKNKNKRSKRILLFTRLGPEGSCKFGPVDSFFHCQAPQVQAKPLGSIDFIGGWKASEFTSGRAKQMAEHHAEQFGGSVLTEAQYARSCRMQVAVDQSVTAGEVHSLKMMDEVAEVIAGLPNRKAQGEDSVPNKILKAGGQLLCLQRVRLCCNANESAAVPLTWKGGLIVTIPKTGGLRQCSNQRAIQTASCMGKVCSKVLRRSLATFFEKYARPDQHGGVKGRGTGMASLTVRRSSQIGKTFAVLFVDAHSAFRSLLQEQVLGAVD